MYVEARSLPHVPYSLQPEAQVKRDYEYISEVRFVHSKTPLFKINIILRDQTQKERSNLCKKSKQTIWQKVSAH